MPALTAKTLAATIQDLQAQMAEMAKHIELLEGRNAAPAPKVAAPPPPKPAITEEELLAISAAIGAYLGVRAHIRQVRLLGTTAWAQQGRVSIQASHMLQG